jgi:hypothetical protein
MDVASCVPNCNAEHHGYELLATIDHMDTKFSCNVAHGLYSWMGAASDGGFLGADMESFFSSVESGAAGFYIVTLIGDAEISTDVAIRSGQDVHVSGAPELSEAPSWGSGDFTIQQFGGLSLTFVQLKHVDILGGGEAHFSTCIFDGGNQGSCRQEGSSFSCESQVISGQMGGALNIGVGATATVRSCTFSYYHVQAQGGAIYLGGNDLSGHASVSILDSQFVSNTANGEGCTLYAAAGSVLTMTGSQVTIQPEDDCGTQGVRVDPGATISIVDTSFAGTDGFDTHHDLYRAITWSNHASNGGDRQEDYSSEEAMAAQPLEGCVPHFCCVPGSSCGRDPTGPLNPSCFPCTEVEGILSEGRRLEQKT